jgi:hypothetical protein
MRKKTWLLLVVAVVLLATFVIRRASTPSAVSGSEVRRPAAAVPVPAPKLQPVEVPSAPAAEASGPQPLVSEVVPEVAAEVPAEVAPAPQEEPPRDRAPQVDAIIAGAGNQLQALVGDVLVSEGSMMQGFRVRKVQADGVVFEKDGQIWVQKLN